MKVKLQDDVNAASLIYIRYSVLVSLLCICSPDNLMNRASLLCLWVYKAREIIYWVNLYARSYFFGLIVRTRA